MGFISEIEGREEIKFNYLKFVIPEDLVAYGFEREFIGRFPVIAVFDPLSQEELFEILSNPNNPIMLNKKRDFKVYGIDLAFTDEALKEIANLAYKENTGARALSRILERILIYFERTLPSKSFKFLGVTEELIKDPEGFLKALLESPNNIRWRENYYKALEDEKKRVKKYVSSKVKYMEEEKFELTPKRLNLIFDLYKERDIELNKALEDVLFLWRQVKNYEKAFERKNNVKIVFTEDTIDTILENAIKKNWGVFAYCEKVMSRLEYSFNYLRDILAEEVFYITPLALKRPQKYVEEYLRKIKQ
jgi:ATP-dependent protease Clp ATPase subunit